MRGYLVLVCFSWSDGPMEEPPVDEEVPLSAGEQKTVAYRAAHLAVLGKVSTSLVAILVTLIALTAILLLRH